MPERSKDWLAQAKRDLNHAVHSTEVGDYEWACFSAQQAAEKAAKAVFFSLHGEGWGHSVFRLLKTLREKMSVADDIIEAAKMLDKHYIPARYPNGFDQGMPGDYYTQKDAKEAIEYAGKILEFCQNSIR